MAVDCWNDNIKLVYDEENDIFRNNDGVEIKVNDFGS